MSAIIKCQGEIYHLFSVRYWRGYPYRIQCVMRGLLIPQGLSGGTTVSATMLCAHQAGIQVFVTGGIGGVHRDGEDSREH